MHSNLLISTTLCLFSLIIFQERALVLGKATADSRSSERSRCTLQLHYNSSDVPIVTNEGTLKNLVSFDDEEDEETRYVRINKGNKIIVNCGRGQKFPEETNHYLRLTCVQGAAFLDAEDDFVVLPNGIECFKSRKPTLAIHKKGTCARNGTNFDVNFVTESPQPISPRATFSYTSIHVLPSVAEKPDLVWGVQISFKNKTASTFGARGTLLVLRKFYSSCVDEQTSGTLYSSSYIDGKSIASGLVEIPNRPDFRGQELYPFPIKQAYMWNNTSEHLTKLLGSADLVSKYFPTQQYRFSRGHLFPNADAIKRFERQATFYYVNTVPQWQILNGGNWVKIEQDVRDLAEKLEKTLEVVTGSFRVTTLPDENNNDVQLWLARDSSGKLRLPVPGFLWKVIHDSVGRAAVAIVQVNNPWVFRSDSDKLCSDICSNLPWLRSSNFHSVRKGYTYCCDVNELRSVIPYIPEVAYERLLGVKDVKKTSISKDNNKDDNETN